MPNIGKKILKSCIIAIVITIIIAGVIIYFLRYEIVGETNMPFDLSKITIISLVGGKDKEDEENKWNIYVEQNNDIYLYIKKNEGYKKTEIIDSILINNFNIDNEENVNIYRPNESSIDIFNNSQEDIIKELVYVGEQESDLKKLKISNQGGMIGFRITNENVANYISNDAEEIKYNELLKICNVEEERLHRKVSFDLIIKLIGGKEYISNISLEIPIENIVEKGRTEIEMTDLESFIFKRLEN